MFLTFENNNKNETILETKISPLNKEMGNLIMGVAQIYRPVYESISSLIGLYMGMHTPPDFKRIMITLREYIRQKS